MEGQVADIPKFEDIACSTVSIMCLRDIPKEKVYAVVGYRFVSDCEGRTDVGDHHHHYQLTDKP